jgi:hypothetical protein
VIACQTFALMVLGFSALAFAGYRKEDGSLTLGAGDSLCAFALVPLAVNLSWAIPMANLHKRARGGGASGCPQSSPRVPTQARPHWR